MENKTYLIADMGASNGRVLKALFDGSRFTLEETYRFENKPVFAGNRLYWDFLRLLSELKEGIRSAAHESKNRIESIGIDTWGCDFGLIDKQGELLANPVHYRDEQRHTTGKRLFEIISEEELFAVSGYFQLTIMSVCELYVMKICKNPVLEIADTLLFMPDLFAYFLTGEKLNEATIADTSLLYNIASHTWDTSVIEKLGLPGGIFRDIIMPGEQIGRLSRKICSELDTPSIPVIAPASHDTPSAVAGIPVENTDSSWGFISLGTWAVVGISVAKPIFSPEILKNGYGHEFYDRSNYFLARNITGLWIIQQCKQCWGYNAGKPFSWKEIIETAETAAPFSSFIDVDHPDFAQVQTHMPEVIAAFCGRTGQPVPQTQAEITRCVFESLVMKFRTCFGQIREYTGKKIDHLHIVGGGSKNSLICRWTADALSIPVTAGPVEATAIGNLLAQMKGTGTISTIEEGHELVRRSFEMKCYEPVSGNSWEGSHERYLSIIRESAIGGMQ